MKSLLDSDIEAALFAWTQEYGQTFCYLANVWVVQCRDGSRFLLEALAVLLFDLLDRHDAAQARVPRSPHFTHASRTDALEDFVRAEFISRCECHFIKGPWFNGTGQR